MGEHRILGVRRRSLEIPIRAGETEIVVGRGAPQRAAAERIAEAMRERSGVEMPVVGDAAYAGWDVRPGRHAILVGSLGDNRAIEFLYYRWLTFVDHAFPGAGGYALTTAWDPWGSGRNALIVGAADPEGLGSATARLRDLILNGDGQVPGVYEVVPGPSLEREREEIAGWAEAGPLRDGWTFDFTGFGGLSHIPAVSWAYVRSGDARIAEGAKKGLMELTRSPVLRTPESQLHLGFWAPMMLWPLLETSPVFSDEDRLKIVRFLHDVLVSEEGAANRGLNRMVETDLPRQNHQTFCAQGLLFGAAYFGRLYGLAEAVEWRVLVDRLFRIGSTCSKPICDNNAHGWYTMGHFATHALLTGSTAFFDSGMGRQAAERAVANCSSNGFVAGVGDGSINSYPYWFLAQAAFYLRDPGLRYVVDQVADEVAPFRCRLADSLNADNDLYLWQQSYDSGVETEPPAGQVGVRAFPLDRHYYDIPKVSPGLWVIRAPNVAHPETFDKLTMRSGWGRGDQHLILDGVGGGSHTYEDANAILMLTQDDRFLLVSADNLYYVAPRYHNMVTVTRNGLGEGLPSFCRLDGKADLRVFGYSATTLPDYVGTDWMRTVVWKKGDFFLVADRIRAREWADYAATCRWFSLGRPEVADGACAFHQSPWKGSPTDFVIRNLTGQDLRTQEAFYGPTFSWRSGFDPRLGEQLRSDRTLLAELDQTEGAALEAGDSIRIVNLLYARSGDRVAERLSVQVSDSGWFRIDGEEGPFLVRLADGVEVASGDLRATCEVLSVWQNGVFAGGCEALSAGGVSIQFSRPCGVEIDAHGRLTVDAFVEATAVWRLSDGRSGEQILAAGSPQGWDVGGVRLPDPEKLWRTVGGVKSFRPRSGAKPEPPQPAWTARVPGRINALHVVPADGAERVLAACEDGVLRGLDMDGRVAWTYETRSPVNTVHSGVLRKGEPPRIVLGCEDEFVRVLDLATRREVWRFRPEYGNQFWAYWSWYRSSIKRVVVDDLDGDGDGEVLVTPGNMRLHLVDASGRERWVYRTDHGTFLTFGAWDVDGDGRKEIVGGCDVLASTSVCRVIGHEGVQRHAFPNAGWTSQLKDLLVEDIDGDGSPELVCAVSREEHLRVHDLAEKARRWGRCLGEVPVGVALLTAPGRRTLLAATEGATASGFDGRGNQVWTVDVSPGATRLVRMGETAAVVCGDGRIVRVSADGEAVSFGLAAPGVTAAARAERFLLVGGEDGRIWAFRS